MKTIIFSRPMPFVRDIGNYEFGSSCSVIFVALQFILYTGVKNLNIVGCDVDGGYNAATVTKVGRAKGTKGVSDPERILRVWHEAKAWCDREYSDRRIHVVRPVGLKRIGWSEVRSTTF